MRIQYVIVQNVKKKKKTGRKKPNGIRKIHFTFLLPLWDSKSYSAVNHFHYFGHILQTV